MNSMTSFQTSGAHDELICQSLWVGRNSKHPGQHIMSLSPEENRTWTRPRPRQSKVHMMQNQHPCCLPLCFASALQPANFLQEMCPFSFPRPWGFQYAFLGKASVSPYALGPATKCRPKLEHSASRCSRVRQHSPHSLHAPTVGGPSGTWLECSEGNLLGS